MQNHGQAVETHEWKHVEEGSLRLQRGRDAKTGTAMRAHVDEVINVILLRIFAHGFGDRREGLGGQVEQRGKLSQARSSCAATITPL